jgi:hypothetical protein
VSGKDDSVQLECSSSFLADQMRKVLPDLKKRAGAFFAREIDLSVETREEKPAEKRIKPSEIRANAMKSQVVKEIITEFNGVVKDVKPNGQ